MAKVNKISSFKSFTEVRKQDTVMKLREENELKRKESVSKLATILDEMGLTSFEGLEEDQKQQIISKIFGDVSEEDIKEIEVEVEEVTESVITEKIDRSVAKRMEGLYLYKKVDEASKILIEVIDDMLEEEFEQEESIEFISLKTQELLENATYATYESVVTEAIDVTGKRDAKKVFTAYKRIMDSMPGISQSKNNNLIKGCIKVLGMYALEDANFHREMSCMNKIKGSISPVEIKVAGLANLAVKVSVNKIKDALQQVTSKVSMAGDWSGIAIAEGTAIYLDSIGATKEGQDMLDMFNSAFESTEELGQKVIEGRAFAAAAKKAKDEGLEEFEFNGKKYPVLIKENTLTESLILEGTRGQFGKIDNKGNITSVYTHYDSYPDNMLPIIKKSFKGGKNVDTILSKGANSGLDSDISKINFYGDGSVASNGSVKRIDKYLQDARDENGAEFVYLWDEKSKKWMMADTYKKTGLVPAFESVITEAKKITKAAIEEIGEFRDGEGYSSNEYYILADWAQDELGDGPYDIKKLEKLLKSKEVQKDMEGNNAVDVEYLEEFSESVVTEAKYNKKSLLKKLGKADDATIQTGNGKEYVIYNPDSNNDDNAAMWNDNSVFAVDQDGEEHEINYKDIGLVLVESNVNEAEVSSAEDFREYATAVLQNAFEEDYDETKAEEVISGLISKHGEDYGAMIGALQSSLA
tara:strand:- start:7562 stop:9652 length:2091 start_codon:yes stop_codon:yes gene_type:complete